MNKNNNKNSLRKKYAAIRKEEIIKVDLLIYKQVSKFLIKYLNSNPSNKSLHIGIYWPLLGEIDLRKLKESFNLPFALPFCLDKNSIEYRPWTDNLLSKDFCGIPAPLEKRVLKPKEISIIFVPALAIDGNGNRLGYGGGFFDRLRANKEWASIHSIVVLPHSCISKIDLPSNEWDIPFKSWITENGEFNAQ